MSATPEQIERVNRLLGSTEGEVVEFKEAKSSYSSDKLGSYGSALANEGGGNIVFGISDKRPRRVVGTNAFGQPEQARNHLNAKLHLQTTVEEVLHPDGRVLIFTVPKHKIGLPCAYDGKAWMRDGESLVQLSEERRLAIYQERAGDFSGEVRDDASFDQLSPEAIAAFRRQWLAKLASQSGDADVHDALANVDDQQLLEDAGVLIDGNPTNAALILFAPASVLRRHLRQAEISYEYRSGEQPGRAARRENFQDGFFLVLDRLWQLINSRNDEQDFEQGPNVRPIPTFAERPTREVILNAVCHRDYQDPNSIFVRQFGTPGNRRIRVESPGGLPRGVTVENILRTTRPRNRTIAEVFERCGLVERSGQGMDLMFRNAVRHAKRLPSLKGTDAFSVFVTLHGEVQDRAFVSFLASLDDDATRGLLLDDYLVLDRVRRSARLDAPQREVARRLRDRGLIETIGSGRGTRYILSRRLYRQLDDAPAYTRDRGLDDAHNRQLLLQHLRLAHPHGVKREELVEVLPKLTTRQVRHLLERLRNQHLIRVEGRGQAARWFLATPPAEPPEAAPSMSQHAPSVSLFDPQNPPHDA